MITANKKRNPTLNYQVDKEVYDKLKKLADKEGRSISSLAKHIMVTYLKNINLKKEK